ncbi:MAG: Asp-tRNA(Asn)/Glu-tRNA(Gln) amidotransferase subunit GatB [Chloroflexi bacterium]|nr:Asp-tRNA(Asn)/Glu-tRNA(Gln) amidotransferase subunit GatB [Chloroflexota bacterium]
MKYETIIGLEVHAQLLTRSKMFCACDARYADDPPNTHVCPICLGMPGVLPVINKRAVEFTMMTALALNCQVSEHTHFDRKNYHYPDLMKGYQISQYDSPVGVRGWLDVDTDGTTRRIGITRVHLEEDVAKLTHATSPWGQKYSLVDVNRSGVPLMEVVSEPDIRSPEEARQYMMKLRAILCCMEVSTGNMEEGSLRCDANISIRQEGTQKFLPKVEIKNLNSFKALYQALKYESERQMTLVESGGMATQETRGWSEEQGITVVQRSKEHAHDYRYFPEPDLPPLSINRQWVAQLAASIPELPDARRNRLMQEYGLPEYDASLLISSKEMADLFEASVALLAQSGLERQKQAKTVSNWLLGDFTRLLNAQVVEIKNTRITPVRMAEFIRLLNKGMVSGPAAKAVFKSMFETGKEPTAIIAEKGLSQITDKGAIEQAVDKVVASNSSAVSDFRAGKEQALTFLVGQTMKLTKGRANPQEVRKALLEKLGKGD